MVPAAFACGYRFGTVRVYIDQTSDTPHNEIRAKIKPILDRHDIPRLELCTTGSTMKQYYNTSNGNDVLQKTLAGKSSFDCNEFQYPGDQRCMPINEHCVRRYNDGDPCQDSEVLTEPGEDVRKRKAEVPFQNSFLNLNQDIMVYSVEEEHGTEGGLTGSNVRSESRQLSEGDDQIRTLSGMD